MVNFVGSTCKLGPGLNTIRFGAEWTAIEEMGLLRGISQRERLVDPKMVIDVHYNDLIAEPVATVKRIYDHFEMDIDDDGLKRAREYLDDNPDDKHGQHLYSAADYGLSVPALRERFGS